MYRFPWMNRDFPIDRSNRPSACPSATSSLVQLPLLISSDEWKLKGLWKLWMNFSHLHSATTSIYTTIYEGQDQERTPKVLSIIWASIGNYRHAQGDGEEGVERVNKHTSLCISSSVDRLIKAQGINWHEKRRRRVSYNVGLWIMQGKEKSCFQWMK